MPAHVRVRGPSTGGRNLRGLNKRLHAMARETAIEVARRIAPVISAEARKSFDGGRDVFNSPRKLGVMGNALSLVELGNARADLRFAAAGTTRITALLRQRYTKYLVGKYKILPCGNQALPRHWWRLIGGIAIKLLDERAGKAVAG